MEKETIQKHPSQLQVAFYNTSGGNTSFYGSDIKANNYISMEISQSELTRDNGRDYYYAKKQIMRLRFSPNQFATLLTAMNTGGGVPATLERLTIGDLPQGKIDPPIVKSKVAKIQKEFEDYKAESLRGIQDLRNEIELLKISKQKKHDINHKISMLEHGFMDNIIFFIGSAQKEVNKMVVGAKSTIESYYTNICIKLGVKALKGGNVKLIEDNNEVNK